MRYNEHSVTGAAAQFVQCIWSLAGDAREALASAAPIVPDGRVELLLNTGDPVERDTTRGPERQSTRHIAGQLTSAIRITPTGQLDIIGIRLHPWAAGAFLGVPMRELRDRMLPAADVPVAEHLLRDAANATQASQRLRLLQVALEARAFAAVAPARAAVNLTRRLMQGTPVLTVGGLARQAGLTTRRVQAIFADQVGLPPVTLARIARLQRALGHARREPRRALSAVAHDCGYYDHSHFVRDCRDIAGEAPGQVLGRSGEVTTAFLDGAG